MGGARPSVRSTVYMLAVSGRSPRSTSIPTLPNAAHNARHGRQSINGRFMMLDRGMPDAGRPEARAPTPEEKLRILSSGNGCNRQI